MTAPDGEPHDRERITGLRGIRGEVVGAEADAPVVGHEGRMPLGHRRFDGLEVGMDEVSGRMGLVDVLPRRRSEGAADLLEVGREQCLRNAQLGRQVDDEIECVERGRDPVDLAGDRPGVDDPVVEVVAVCVEPVDDPLIGRTNGEMAAVGFGRHEPFVGELGERLAHEEAVGPFHRLGREVGDEVPGARTDDIGKEGGHRRPSPSRLASNWARVDVLRAAVLRFRSISLSTTNPAAALSAAMLSFRTSGSTTTRSWRWSAKQNTITVRMTSAVNPGLGQSDGATSTCIPTSPGSTS